jgi:pSer/pThr/pTyr-binding forkhead associated (FHA) protein
MAGSPRVQLSLKGRLLSEVAFAGPQLRIGRMRENDVVVNNLAVSRFHAVLRREGEGFALEDLGSENGTQLNGKRITGSVPIEAGDVIQLGKYELRIAANPGVQIAGAPKAKASDAWDASQTFLALEPPAAPAAAKPAAAPAASAKPMIPPSPLASAKPAPARSAAPAPSAAPALSAAPAVAPSAPSPQAVEEELALPMLDAIELEPEAESQAAAPPDPDGVFAFGEDEIASEVPEPPSARAETPPPATPNPEHTSLFDFGAPEPAEVPAAARIATSAGAQGAPPAEAARKLYAGLIVQRDGKLHLLRTWEDGDLCAGRAPECEIVLADAGVSRRHAIFTRSGGRHVVRDLDSVNGIYVNGQRTKQHELSVGDVVRVECFELTFVLDHSPIGSEVSGPKLAPAKPQAAAHATQFSLEAPARESEDTFEVDAVAADPVAPVPHYAPAAFEETTDGFEILPPADDPLMGAAQTAESVLSPDLAESDLLSGEAFDDDEKDATLGRVSEASAPRAAALAAELPQRARALHLRLVVDTAQLSPRARTALAALVEEGVELSARLSLATED